LGSRYVPGGQDSNRSFKRTFLSKFANFYLRHLFGIKVQDCTSGFRGYRRSVLEKIQLNTLNTPGPALLADILFRASLLNLKIGEIPIVFTDRRAGHSQFNFQKIAEGFLHPLRLKFNQRKIKNLLTS